MDIDGIWVEELLPAAFEEASQLFQSASRGEMRYLNGETVTDLLYTGQKLDSYINLYWYSSRWYDASLGHFIQPDIIVPDSRNSLDSNRYAYVNYNPLKYSIHPDMMAKLLGMKTHWIICSVMQMNN